MARQVRRISELPEAAVLTGDELLEIVQNGGNKRVRVGDLPGGGGGGAVQSVQGRTGNVVITADDVGLGSVDNTSDADKPVSTAQQAALDGKVDKAAGMGLSSNDFTDPLRDKLIGLEGTHWRGTFVSLAALQAGVTDPAAGDYADVDSVGADVGRYIWDATDGIWVAQSGSVAQITASQVKQLYESNPDTNAFTDADEAKLGDVQPWAYANTAAEARDGLGLGSGATGDVVQEVGNSQTDVMSQKATTDALATKVDNDDPRLTDSREWSEATVPQAEAEAGTASTRRAWTAQRVRQAIVAWWLGVTSTLGRTLVGRTTATEMRGDLELGTAATRNVGTASGNVMEVGAGGVIRAIDSAFSDADEIQKSARILGLNLLYDGGRPTNAELNGPSSFLTVGGTMSGGNYYGGMLQFARDYNRVFYRTVSAGTWVELCHTGNILTTTGQSTEYPMTQKAVTDAINGVSDRRDKIDITPNEVGLNLIEKLEPVSFKLNKRDWYRNQAATSFETHTDEDGTQTEVEKINSDILSNPLTDYDNNDGSLARNDRYTGLIAQDVKATLEDLGLGDLAIIKNYSDEYEGGDDRHYIEYNGLIPIMINAIKELSERVKVLEAKPEG